MAGAEKQDPVFTECTGTITEAGYGLYECGSAGMRHGPYFSFEKDDGWLVGCGLTYTTHLVYRRGYKSMRNSDRADALKVSNFLANLLLKAEVKHLKDLKGHRVTITMRGNEFHSFELLTK